ncbi:hypothetical protein B0H14DRAFT_3706463 [Mycena olivaceomarginata]|nr:hypothetical protein B0H14DRAFT_3706463 [Mycena olivaceomarginata]
MSAVRTDHESSSVIRTLTHLDLVDTRISGLVLGRVAHAAALVSLTLHGTFEDVKDATVIFAGDHVLDEGEGGGRQHTLLPHLHSLLVRHDDQHPLYAAVAAFLARRPLLRRLDLGSCPWELVRSLLPTLSGLKVLGVRISHLNSAAAQGLWGALPRGGARTAFDDRRGGEGPALQAGAQKPAWLSNEHAPALRAFPALAFLHLQTTATHRPKPNLVSEREFAQQTEGWVAAARGVARALPGLDFLGWHGEHYVVVRRTGERRRLDGRRENGEEGEVEEEVELKELPCRRHLDCGKGVDVGGEDVTWLERKDVPIDYEIPVMCYTTHAFHPAIQYHDPIRYIQYLASESSSQQD